MTPPKGSEPAAVRDLVARVRRTIDDRELLKGGERVLLAVSGGPDSLAMLHAMARLRRRYGLELIVAHFDHRLRPGSERDLAVVAREAGALRLPVVAGAAETTERAPGTSPEEDARDKRMAFLQATARDRGAVRVATAHTLDDQAETVLMRMLQGHGIRGMSGINPRRWYYVRPLIDTSRAQVEAFCRALRLRPVRDPTNDDPAFLRNHLRHEVIPPLEQRVNANLKRSLARISDVLRDEDAYLDERAAAGAPAEVVDGRARVSVEQLAALPPALQRRALRLMTWLYNGVVHTAEHTERMRILALRGRTGQRIDLPEGLRASLEYGYLVVAQHRPLPSASPETLVVPGETDLVAWNVRVRAWIGAERPERWPDGRSNAVVDADRIAFPLRVRRWAPGDRFRPLGMRAMKKVGDFFTDSRVPERERGRVPLIVDEADRIVWIVGHRIDDRCKVGDDTARFLWMGV